MVTVYREYTRDRIGLVFGLGGGQLIVLGLGALPVFICLQRGLWTAALAAFGVWLLVAVVVVVPVRGRSATGWFLAATRHLIGTTLRWSSWRSNASHGRVDDLDAADLPGVLSAVEVHDGPPHGPTQTRVAVIQHHTARTWAVTARVTHPGIGMADGVERDRFGAGLSQLLEAASRTELVDEIQLLVRTVPDDGAERTLWLTNHRRPDAPALARQANNQLQAVLTGAAVRSEAFVTVLVPEARIGRKAREHGRGIDGRARVLYCGDGGGGSAAPRPGRHERGHLVDVAGVGGGVPDRVRPRRPRRHRRRPRRPHNQPSGERPGAVGARRAVRRRPDGAALQPRRLEQRLRHPHPPRQRCRDRSARAGPDPVGAGRASQLPGVRSRSWPSRSRTGGRRTASSPLTSATRCARRRGSGNGPAAAPKPPASAASTPAWPEGTC